jgi:hypothetical protein
VLWWLGRRAGEDETAAIEEEERARASAASRKITKG